MKKVLVGLFLIVSLVYSLQVFAAELSDDEKKALTEKVTAMFDSYESGDPTRMIAFTHSSLISVMGGIANYSRVIESAAGMFQQQGMEFLGAEVGIPTQLYDAGEEEVTIVPRISVMTVQGQALQDIGFVVAIRPKGSIDNWTFLNGAGMRRNKDSLWNLLPNLDRNIDLPVNVLERVELE